MSADRFFSGSRTVGLISSTGCISAAIVICVQTEVLRVIDIGHRQFGTGPVKHFNACIRRN